MFSHDIANHIASHNYTISLCELNKMLSDSWQARYEIIYQDEKDTRIRLNFNDRDSIEVNVLR